jgi:transcriptional regulator with XRE-family HTH domain
MIGKNLKKLREERKLTRSELAKIIGTTSDIIELVEYSKIQPTYTLLLRYAELFNTTITELTK